MNISKIECPGCGARIRLPVVWMLGMETVFRCKKCGQIFKTGYKTGAVLMALSLTLALVTAHLLVYLLSSATLPVVVVLIIPIWLLYGLLMRRAVIKYKCRRAMGKERKK